MSENKEPLFRVGDVVWCLALGKGHVTGTNGYGTYSIIVEFEDEEVSYTPDGELFPYGQRTLFFSEPIITAERERPFKPTMIGSLVAVKNLTDDLYFGPVIAEEEMHFTLKQDYEEFRFSKNTSHKIVELP